jgi:hypothetical protein
MKFIQIFHDYYTIGKYLCQLYLHKTQLGIYINLTSENRSINFSYLNIHQHQFFIFLLLTTVFYMLIICNLFFKNNPVEKHHKNFDL